MHHSLPRRRFLQHLGAAGLTPSVLQAAISHFESPDPLVGIQVSPFNFFDEGLERCLDILQETAGVNALFCYSQTYHMGYSRPPEVLADHGFGIKDIRRRNMPRIWVRTHDEFYKNTILGHQLPGSNMEYADRDFFSEITEPARKRGIKVYARILEASANRKDLIPDYGRVLTVDVEGRPGRGPCWNHPDYRAWVVGTVRDLVSNYPLDGLQYGAERTGPLSYLIDRGLIPTCFCEHCNARNAAKGIDPARAKEGYAKLYQFIQRVEGGDRPLDGVMAGVYRLFQQYPEVLAWNYQWFQADNEIHQEIFDAAKAIRPNLEVGRHVDHQRSSWDIWYRAAVSYADMTASADFIKPILYHDIFGPRLRQWVVETMQQRAYNDLSPELTLALFYAQFGHDAVAMPSLQELDERGLGPAYVRRETERCVQGVDGKAKVYPGIGIDVPWHLPEGGMKAVPSPLESTREAVRQAFAAGADGILISREYDEMRLESLRAIGEAIREIRR